MELIGFTNISKVSGNLIRQVHVHEERPGPGSGSLQQVVEWEEQHHLQTTVLFSFWMGKPEGRRKETRERPKRGWNKRLFLPTTLGLWGKLKLEAREKGGCGEWSGEVVLWSVLRRTAAEAGIKLTYLQIQVHHFLFILYLCHLQQVNFLRNKMNAIIISHLRGHLSGVKEIMFARCLLPHPKHSECWIGGWW